MAIYNRGGFLLLLRYRYTIDDLGHLLNRLLKRAEFVDSADYKPIVPALAASQKRTSKIDHFYFPSSLFF